MTIFRINVTIKGTNAKAFYLLSFSFTMNNWAMAMIEYRIIRSLTNLHIVTQRGGADLNLSDWAFLHRASWRTISECNVTEKIIGATMYREWSSYYIWILYKIPIINNYVTNSN